jgi:uncharacterized repeat protein (TIGR01451 family)
VFYKKITLFFILSSLCFPAFGVWVDAGGGSSGNAVNVSENPGVGYLPSIAIDSKGYPQITWYDNSSGSNQIYYLRWNGFNWVDAFGSASREHAMITSTPYSAQNPKIAVDSSDNPHIVWEDGSSLDREIYYLFWDGNAWQDYMMTAGANQVISNSVNNSSHPEISMDGSDRPCVSWVEEDPTDNSKSDIYYASLSGGSWHAADGSGIAAPIFQSGYYAMSQSMVLDAAGRPCIAWSDGPDENREIYYLHWNGSAWVDAVGIGQAGIDISNTPDYSAWPCVDLDPSGNPNIVWEDDSDGDQNIFFLKWNGSAWVDASGSASQALINMNATFHYSTEPSIKVDASYTPHIIWSEGAIETCDIYCWKWNGTQWSDETGSGMAFQDIRQDNINSEWPSLAIDKNANPHVVWSDGVIYNHHDIYYMHWEKDGTPTVSPTINLSATPYPTFTVTPTITMTATITHTMTMTPYVTPVLTPPAAPCWEDVKGPGWQDNPASYGDAPVLQLDSQGRPVIAFINSDGVYCLKWNGIDWADASGAGLSNARINGSVFNNASPDMKLDAQGRPAIAWTGFVSGYTFIYYLRWNGSAWVDVAGNDQLFISIPFIAGGFAQGVSLALDAQGAPGVAYNDFYSQSTFAVNDIFYFKWNGSNWTDAGGAGAITQCAKDSRNASLVFDTAGNPGISWIYYDAVPSLRYLKRTPSGWADSTGSGTASMDVTNDPAIVEITQQQLKLDNNGMPGIAFTAGLVSGFTINRVPCYIHFNGTAWTGADGAGQANIALPVPPSLTKYTSLAFDAAGRPNIAWQALDGIYYARWYGNHWEGADPSNPGVFRITGQSTEYFNKISLCLDTAGHANVLWGDGQGSSTYDYFLRSACGMPVNTATITPTSTISPTFTVTPTQGSAVPTPAPVTVSVEKSAETGAGDGEIVYTVTLSNDPDKFAYNLVAWDTLPEGVAFEGTISGPDPAVNGRLLTWNFGGGSMLPGEVDVISFKVRITDSQNSKLRSNVAAADYNDDYYGASRHPAVYSNQAFYPEGVIAVYPNPFSLSKAVGGTLKFVNMPVYSRLEIYTLSGELIELMKSTDTNAYWDGKNSYGTSVSPGIYYYVIFNVSGKYIQKGKIFFIK